MELNGAEGFLQRKVRKLLLHKGIDTGEAKPKDTHSTNCTEKLSEEEPYGSKIKLHTQYLTLRKILEKRKLLYLKTLDNDYRKAYDNLNHEIVE